MSTLKVDTLTTTDAANSIATERVANGTAAAWVNFNGTGTVSIRGGYNVSSITDNGTGNYTVIFANDMEDTNYVIVTGCGSGDAFGQQQHAYTPNYYSVGSCRIFTVNDDAATTAVASDAYIINVAVFR